MVSSQGSWLPSLVIVSLAWFFFSCPHPTVQVLSLLRQCVDFDCEDHRWRNSRQIFPFLSVSLANSSALRLELEAHSEGFSDLREH